LPDNVVLSRQLDSLGDISACVKESKIIVEDIMFQLFDAKAALEFVREHVCRQVSAGESPAQIIAILNTTGLMEEDLKLAIAIQQH